ncbi:hypothetical protein SNK04_013988 [Fusarium graminearum]
MVAAEVAPAGAASVELPPTTPTEAAAIVEQRLTTLDELSRQDRLTPEQVSEYRQEDAALVDVIRRQEQLARENIVPADPRSESAVRNSTR